MQYKDLIIINNEKIFQESNNFYCDNLDLKILPEDLNKYYDFDNDGFLDKLIGIEWYDSWPIAAITKRKIDGLYEFIFFNMMSEEGKKKAKELSDWY